MGDALTDARRVMDRDEAYGVYLEALLGHLSQQETMTYEQVVLSAERVDAVPGRGRTQLAARVENLVLKYTAGDKQEWSQLLFRLQANWSPLFNSFKEISPFAGQLLVFVNYGNRFVTLEGELQRVLDGIITQADRRTYDCDKYLVTIGGVDVNQTEVVWMGCGIEEQNEPRRAAEFQKR